VRHMRDAVRAVRAQPPEPSPATASPATASPATASPATASPATPSPATASTATAAAGPAASAPTSAGPSRRAAEPVLQVAGWLGNTASFGAKVPTVIFGPGGAAGECPDED